MADCHHHFIAFEAAISPSESEIRRLLEVRRAARRLIGSATSRAGLEVAFHPQGSFRLLTAVRRDGLDIDDGILLRASDLTTKPSVEEVLQLVYFELRQHGLAVLPRVPCLRVLYPDGVRLDIVTYLRFDDGNVSLAHRSDGWVSTHSSLLIGWFENLAGATATQLRRLIKYYKIWAARMAQDKMPSGVALTILISLHHQSHERDDLAMIATLRSVLYHVEAGHGCPRPTPPAGEELLSEELTPPQLHRFVELLRGFVATGERALASTELDSAVRRWQSLFGPCFGDTQGSVSSRVRAEQLRLVLEDTEAHAHLCRPPLVVRPAQGSESWTL